VNEWRFEICLKMGADQSRAVKITDTLREEDRVAGRSRLGEVFGDCWPFDSGATDLDQEAARREAEQELRTIDDGALAVLDVRPAE
jgi:hypothetical protein